MAKALKNNGNLTINYPEDLPVSLKRAEIAKAIENNQVVIVSGETGSGKTTQLPKICLDIGRGTKKTIAHTQPRRLAATSVANRVAQELGTELGHLVGYQIRFSDKTSEHTAIKLMTDGILLAQTQKDPLLRQYDTIIIDEAHERSLNIDFLLGFLKQLLPKRPDLKLVITSATIDADRFSQHFADDNGPAPVINVSGRLYPVEIVYKPILSNSASLDEAEEIDDEQNFISAVIDAVNECCSYGDGDILVFLPGEREIRDVADALGKDKSITLDVLPLFARLSRAEQERIFRPKTIIRRVVLATNVAETSLTVPGIRYVVDSGLARIKRYSWRNKVEQLQIERISQASANQRAGRCGRIGPGVCIRLYDEEDFQQRDKFTDPEILRSSLASVILRMKSLNLQDIDEFPFVDAPHGRAIADGYQILHELGAIDEQRNLTKTGALLARLPIDPKLARIILAANQYHCLTETLIIVSALSVQDPRERPVEKREAAMQAHAKFKDKQSEFMSYVNLWNWYHDSYEQRESQRKFVATLRKSFISPARMREWRDIHEQLRSLIKGRRWRFNGKEATYEQVHTALLTGLLGNIGVKDSVQNHYLGARGIKFLVHPSSYLARRSGKWLVAGELVETSRLFALCVANIKPLWIERAGSHLLKKTWSEPRWEKRRGQVVASERATLYGVIVYSGRRVHYGRIDPVHAREIFIREALIEGNISSKINFLQHNIKVVHSIESLEHKSRRPDILVDDELIYSFYDAQIPQNVFQTATLLKWLKGLNKSDIQNLYLSRDELMRHEASGITSDIFPKSLTIDGVEMRLSYHFEPGSPRDGITLEVPLYALNKIRETPLQWLVPGMLKEKVHALVRSLPQRIRRHCVPIPDYANAFYSRWFETAVDPSIPLLDAIVQDIHRQFAVEVAINDFKLESLAPHLFMNFKVVDEHGRMLSGGRNLQQLRAEHSAAAHDLFKEVADKTTNASDGLFKGKITEWSFGELPELLEVRKGKQTLIGYPALSDKGDHCSIEVFDDAGQAQLVHKKGLIRLFRMHLREQVRYLYKNIDKDNHMALMFMRWGTQEELKDQIIDKAIEIASLSGNWPANKDEFEQLCATGRGRLVLLATELSELVKSILSELSELQRLVQRVKTIEYLYDDIKAQQESLFKKGFILNTPYEQLKHYIRYVRAMTVRLDKFRNNPVRDQELTNEIQAIEARYKRAKINLKGKIDPDLEQFAWLLQELRVGLFAQELRTPMPVSIKRINKVWETLQYS